MLEKSVIKDTMYGGIYELMQNSKYFYRSSVGVNYCHWTEPGVQALSEYLKLMTPMIMEYETQNLDKRAKELVLKGLKGET